MGFEWAKKYLNTYRWDRQPHLNYYLIYLNQLEEPENLDSAFLSNRSVKDFTEELHLDQ